jgi:hypothetical protein
MRVVLNDGTPLPAALKVGARYRLEVRPDASAPFACLAEVRHVTALGIGFEKIEEIPMSLILRDAPPP